MKIDIGMLTVVKNLIKLEETAYFFFMNQRITQSGQKP